MPYIEVKAFEHRITDDAAERLAQTLTDALCEALGDEVREATWIVIEGVSPKRWSIGGKLSA